MENPTPPGTPKKGNAQKTNPSGEENFPKSDPMRKSAERSMDEPSPVRPPNDPTPDKRPEPQTAKPQAASEVDADVEGG